MIDITIVYIFLTGQVFLTLFYSYNLLFSYVLPKREVKILITIVVGKNNLLFKKYDIWVLANNVCSHVMFFFCILIYKLIYFDILPLISVYSTIFLHSLVYQSDENFSVPETFLWVDRFSKSEGVKNKKVLKI